MDCLLDQQDSRDTNHDSQQYLAARHAEQHSQKQYSYGDPLHDVRHHRIICFLLVQTLRANLGCLWTGLTFELYVRLPPALSGGRVLFRRLPFVSCSDSRIELLAIYRCFTLQNSATLLDPWSPHSIAAPSL
jgi:hypothetical protein